MRVRVRVRALVWVHTSPLCSLTARRGDPDFDNADVEMERERHKIQLREMAEEREQERRRHAEQEQALDRRLADQEREWQERLEHKDEEMTRLTRAHAAWKEEERRVMGELKDKHTACDARISALRRQVSELESQIEALVKENVEKDENLAAARSVSDRAAALLSTASKELEAIHTEYRVQQNHVAALRSQVEEVHQGAAGESLRDCVQGQV